MEDDFSQYELGRLMFPLAEHCYLIAARTSVNSVTDKLEKLFVYQPEAVDQPSEFEDIHHAYGLLRSHCNSDNYHDVIRTELDKIVKTEEELGKLYNKAKEGKHEKLFNFFVEEMIRHSIQMVSVSPPMVLHKQDTFDKSMAMQVLSENPQPPLQWTQPVLMRNCYGHVCVKGRVDNAKELSEDK